MRVAQQRDARSVADYGNVVVGVIGPHLENASVGPMLIPVVFAYTPRPLLFCSANYRHSPSLLEQPGFLSLDVFVQPLQLFELLFVVAEERLSVVAFDLLADLISHRHGIGFGRSLAKCPG